MDEELLEKAQQLEDDDKLELAYALLRTVQASEPVSPETAALIDQRVAHAEQHRLEEHARSGEYVSSDKLVIESLRDHLGEPQVDEVPG
ncbi:hypothetical protein [Nesterenkonia alba]|uniref:hypothetical protein n=1 Tax=Nesterenkonia alba TaxID=515814 RepID=UPI0003B5AEEA|nr:hypothetical protein [Nesterenkonia alba]